MSLDRVSDFRREAGAWWGDPTKQPPGPPLWVLQLVLLIFYLPKCSNRVQETPDEILFSKQVCGARSSFPRNWRTGRQGESREGRVTARRRGRNLKHQGEQRLEEKLSSLQDPPFTAPPSPHISHSTYHRHTHSTLHTYHTHRTHIPRATDTYHTTHTPHTPNITDTPYTPKHTTHNTPCSHFSPSGQSTSPEHPGHLFPIPMVSRRPRRSAKRGSPSPKWNQTVLVEEEFPFEPSTVKNNPGKKKKTPALNIATSNSEEFTIWIMNWKSQWVK